MPAPSSSSSAFGEIRVGVGVVLYRPTRASWFIRLLRHLHLLPHRYEVLLGQRKNAHGAGEWSFPGGHQDKGERARDAALRELLEETGISLPPDALREWTFTDDFFTEIDRQYTTVYLVAACPSGVEPQNDPTPEPDKCDRWVWHRWDALPRPLFSGLQSLIDRGDLPFP